jgi:predicted negative regulator of RcsB-dependent stress response
MTEEYMTDDEQVEHVKRLVAENWLWVIGGVALGAAFIFGYRYYDGYRNERALRAATQFGEMASQLEHNERAKSALIAQGLIQNFPGSPYADQAQLTLARLAVDDGKLADAVAPLTQVMNASKDEELRHIARLRLARVQVDQGKPDDAIKTLAEDKPGSFAARFHEVRGDAFFAKQDPKGAVAEYKAALEAGEAGGVNPALLQLKIADLSQAEAPPAAASMPAAAPPPAVPVSAATAAPPATVPSASAPMNKAKP